MEQARKELLFLTYHIWDRSFRLGHFQIFNIKNRVETMEVALALAQLVADLQYRKRTLSLQFLSIERMPPTTGTWYLVSSMVL